MRYVVLLGLLGLAVAVDLSLFIAASGNALQPFDPFRPATILPIATSRLNTLASQVRALDVRYFFDAVPNRSTEGVRPEGPTSPAAR